MNFRRLLLASLLLSSSLGAVLLGGARLTPRPPAFAVEASSSRAAAIAAVQGATPWRYAIERLPAAARAPDRGQGVEAIFSGQIEISTAGGQAARMKLRRAGCGERPEDVEPVEPVTEGNRVSYRHDGGLEAWYVSGPLGVEQGFTFAHDPGCQGGQVVVEMDVESTLSPVLSAGGERVEFREGDEVRLAYSDLHTIDASGRVLPSRLALDGRRLSLLVDARSAVFPVIVDPLIGVPRNDFSGQSGLEKFGASVSLDGTTCFVGIPARSGGFVESGHVQVYTRSGDTWSVAQEIAPPAQFNQTYLNFGAAVALRGSVAFVGAPGRGDPQLELTNAGIVFIYNRLPDGSWTEAGSISSPLGGGAAFSRFGSTLAFDGVTLAVGAPEESYQGFSYNGGVHLFTLNPAVWLPQDSLSAVTDGADTPDGRRFGGALAIEGARLLVGAAVDNGYTGKVYPFKRQGVSWVKDGNWLQEPVGKPDRYFGVSVALSGNDAFVGATSTQSAGPGSVLQYTYQTGAGWLHSGTFLGANSELYFGTVAADATTLLVGSPQVSTKGGVYVYKKEGNAWLQAFLHTGTPDYQGATLSISQNAFVVGGPDSGPGNISFVDILALDGTSCNAGAECQSGFCTDGVCCNTDCTGPCVSCLSGDKADQGPDGVCGAVHALSPDPLCPTDLSICGPKGACGADGVCDPFAPPETPCWQVCSAINETSTGVCAFGTCVANPQTAASCGLYTCSLQTGDCLLSCSANADCAPPALCQSGVCATSQENGKPCQGDDQCISGFCADGVCCDTKCEGTCFSCLASDKGDGSPDGACGLVAAGMPDPACASDSTPCGPKGTCDGTGSCQTAANDGVICGGTCVGLFILNISYCQSGLCQTPSQPATSCAPYLCVEGQSACPTACATSAECVLGAICYQEACRVPDTNGTPCETGETCLQGYCVDGVCCDAPCDGPCQACSVGQGAAKDGQCGPANEGEVCPGGTCQQGVCGPTGGAGAGGEAGAGGSAQGGEAGAAGEAGSAGDAGAAGEVGAGGAAGGVAAGGAAGATSGAGGAGGKAGPKLPDLWTDETAGAAGAQSGGMPGSGGVAQGTGGSGNKRPPAPNTTPVITDEGGCGCRAAGEGGPPPGAWVCVAAVGLLCLRRRRGVA